MPRSVDDQEEDGRERAARSPDADGGENVVEDGRSFLDPTHREELFRRGAAVVNLLGGLGVPGDLEVDSRAFGSAARIVQRLGEPELQPSGPGRARLARLECHAKQTGSLVES